MTNNDLEELKNSYLDARNILLNAPAGHRPKMLQTVWGTMLIEKGKQP